MVADFGNRSGWDLEDSREVLDVNQDGRADIIGFGYFGVAESYGPSLNPMSFHIHEFGTLQDWRGDRHLRTLADVNGDGLQDLLGFGNAGVRVAHGRPNNTIDTPYPKSSFGAPSLKVGEFGYNDGWRQDRYPRLLGDVNGDGREDVVGFGHSATYVKLF
ncbi:UNVERIFIED_CONTAM: FG-GAP-like repeat-containing protein [Kocuria sp. CPCC 205300]